MQQARDNRDALGLIRLTRELDQVKAQREADINSENARYEADKANLDAQC